MGQAPPLVPPPTGRHRRGALPLGLTGGGTVSARRLARADRLGP